MGKSTLLTTGWGEEQIIPVLRVAIRHSYFTAVNMVAFVFGYSD
jgi:hypothetical protein